MTDEEYEKFMFILSRAIGVKSWAWKMTRAQVEKMLEALREDEEKYIDLKGVRNEKPEMD